MESCLAKDLCVVYNSLLNHDYKLDRLLSSVDEIIKLKPKEIKIRVRGKCSQIAIEKLYYIKKNLKSTTNLDIYKGENFREWKLNTMEMFLDSKSAYVLLMQEDYKINCSSEKFIHYLNYCFKQGVDYIRISNPSIVNNFNFVTSDVESSVNLFMITRENWEDYKSDQRYLLSFPGCYKSEIFLKNLLSNRPYLRKYHPFSPFDFEKGPNQIWLLPLHCSVANFEILSCVDDDLGFPGSSLQSRGMIKIDKLRNHRHVSSWSSRNFFFKLSALSRRIFYKNGLSGNANLPKVFRDLISFSLNFIYKFLFLIDILRYSAQAHIYFVFNFKGLSLRKKVKIKLFKLINNSTDSFDVLPLKTRIDRKR